MDMWFSFLSGTRVRVPFFLRGRMARPCRMTPPSYAAGLRKFTGSGTLRRPVPSHGTARRRCGAVGVKSATVMSLAGQFPAMTLLSVNLNKIAVLRNERGEGQPDI